MNGNNEINYAPTPLSSYVRAQERIPIPQVRRRRTVCTNSGQLHNIRYNQLGFSWISFLSLIRPVVDFSRVLTILQY